MNIGLLNNIYKTNFFLPKGAAPIKQGNENIQSRDIYAHLDGIKNYNIPFLGKIKSNPEEKASVYAIDAYGNYVKFANIDEASKATKIEKEKISQCTNGDIDCAKDFVFAFAPDIETHTRSGLVPDEMMLKLAVDIIKSTRKSKKKLENLADSFKDNPNFDVFAKKERKMAPKTPSENNVIEAPKEKRYRVRDIKEEPLTDKIKERYAKSSFYVMDESGKYKKFYRQAHVANSFGEDNRVVYKCLVGKQLTMHGLVFAYAHEVESEDENGNVVLNLDKLKSKLKKEEGIYAVDRAGKYKKFNGPDEVIEKLKISKARLWHCLLGRQDATSGYAFFRAKDLEIKNADGSISIDAEKIDDAKVKIISKAIYVIDADGKYTRYDSQAEAAKALGVAHGAIYRCLTGQVKTVMGNVILPASEVETYSQNGFKTISISRINKALEASKKLEDSIDVRQNGFYAIDKNGEYKKFYSITSAGKELGVHLTSMSNCLKGLRNFACGYTYVRAEDIEIEGEDGEMKPDEAKIAQKLKVFDGRPFYAIDKDGKCTRFNNQTEASKELGVPSYLISKCLLGKAKVASEYVFIYADEIEIEDDNEVSLNQEIINEKATYINRHAFYAIDKDGNYERFSTRDEAVDKLGINLKTLSGCLCGNSKTAKGYTFISASQVEIRHKDGSVSIDEDKIKAMTEMFKKQKREL